jgi:hypothetical protein
MVKIYLEKKVSSGMTLILSFMQNFHLIVENIYVHNLLRGRMDICYSKLTNGASNKEFQEDGYRLGCSIV